MNTTPPPMPNPYSLETLAAIAYEGYTVEYVQARDAQWMERITALESDRAMLREALENMAGAFDTPIQRRRLGRSSIYDQAIESARTALERTHD
jgi:hypothetical protein